MVLVPNLYVWKITTFICLGSVLIGYYDSSMNGILEMKCFQIFLGPSHSDDSLADAAANYSSYNTNYSNNSPTCSSSQGTNILTGLTVSVSSIGSGIGCLFAGWLSDRFSRKYGLIISGLVISLGSILLASSFYIYVFIVGRIISGFGFGIIYMLMPLYISEMTPKGSRGFMVSLVGLGYSFGHFIGLGTNVGFSQFCLGWRVAIIIQALAGLLYSSGMRWMPQTPRWLVTKQRDQEALLVLSKINWQSQENTFIDTYIELEELKESASIDSKKSKYRVLLREMSKWKYISRLLLIIFLFFITATVSNFIYLYSATLFCEVGIALFIAALAVGLINFIAALVLVIFIDKVGRKVTLLCGSSISTILAVVTASLSFVYASSNNHVVTYTVVVIISIYAFSISCSWLTVPWVLASEVFPVNVRGFCVAVSTASYWLISFCVNQLIPIILGSPALNVHGFFFIITGISFVSIFVVLFALPETKGVSLEKMDTLFSDGFLKRLCLAQCNSRCTQQKDTSEKKKSMESTKERTSKWGTVESQWESVEEKKGSSVYHHDSTIKCS